MCVLDDPVAAYRYLIYRLGSHRFEISYLMWGEYPTGLACLGSCDVMVEIYAWVGLGPGLVLNYPARPDPTRFAR